MPVLRVSTPLSLLLLLNVALLPLILLPLIVPLPPLMPLLLAPPTPPLRPLRSSILSPGLLAWSAIIHLLPQYSSVMKSRLLDVHGESGGLAGREPRLSENQMRKRQAAISGRGRTACDLSEECGFLPLVQLCEALPRLFSPPAGLLCYRRALPRPETDAAGSAFA